MTWAVLLPIIAKFGIEAAEHIWQKWSTGALPTQADWDILKKLGQQTPEDLILAAAASMGISPDDARVKELLALAKPTS